jgi:hypothetical protein
MAQINKPSEYFNTKLYTGNGSTKQLTGVGFQPDWVWFKRRNSALITMKYLMLLEVQQKIVATNLTGAEEQTANFGLSKF